MTLSPSRLMKLTNVVAAALGDLDAGAPPLCTSMTWMVQSRAVPKDLRREKNGTCKRHRKASGKEAD